MVKRGAAFTGMPEEDFLVRVETDLRKRHIRLHDVEGGRSQIELALSFLYTAMEQHRNTIIELAALFGISKDVYYPLGLPFMQRKPWKELRNMGVPDVNG